MNALSAEQLKAKLLNDPDTQAIAQALQLPLAEYVEEVLAFRADPDREPEVELEEDAPEPVGGLDALLLATAAELEKSAQHDDGFETRRATLVVF